MASTGKVVRVLQANLHHTVAASSVMECCLAKGTVNVTPDRTINLRPVPDFCTVDG